MKSRTVQIGLLQKSCSEDPSVNLEQAIQSIRDIAKDGAQVICLQEVFNTQYPCQSEDHANFELAEPIPGPTTTAISKIAKELGVVVVVPLF